MRDAFFELERMRNRIDRMVDNVWGSGLSGYEGLETRTLVPCMDMSKHNGNLIVEMYMPGVSKEDINLRLTNAGLSVFAKKKEIKKEKGEGYYKSERTWKSYGRSATLPVKIDPNKAEAKYEKGTLKITAPIAEKKEEKGVG